MSLAVKRDSLGRFPKGVSGNPTGMQGKRVYAKRPAYLDAMMAECSLGDWRLITRTAITDAIAGKASARTWLSNYILGPAHALVDRDSDDHAIGDGTVERKLVRLMAVIEETTITEETTK